MASLAFSWSAGVEPAGQGPVANSVVAGFVLVVGSLLVWVGRAWVLVGRVMTSELVGEVCREATGADASVEELGAMFPPIDNGAEVIGAAAERPDVQADKITVMLANSPIL